MVRPDPRVPLDPDDDASGLDDELLGELLDPSSDEPAPNAEGTDDDAPVFETEIALDEPPALSADDGIELDAGDPLDEIAKFPEGGFGDEDASLGFDENDRHLEFEALTPLERDDLPDGPDEPIPSLDLPELEHHEPGDDRPANEQEDELPEALSLGDEPRPDAAAVPWRLDLPALEGEVCGALSVADGTVIAASTDLLWFSRGAASPLRLEAGAARIHSVVLVGSQREYALCSTTIGRLFRRGRSATAPEEVRLPRGLAEPRAGREPLDLFQCSAAAGHSLVARTGSGVLVRSDDDGATYRAIAAPRCLALAHGGSPLLVLVEGGLLLQSSDGGSSFGEIQLPRAVRELARSRTPLLAAHGPVLALGASSTGVVVSHDAGRAFVRVPGTRGVTALTAADTPDGPRVFAALDDEALDRSLLVAIDPAGPSATVIATIAGGPGEDALDRVAVARLEWDAEASRLWVAGAFGVKTYSPA